MRINFWSGLYNFFHSDYGISSLVATKLVSLTHSVSCVLFSWGISSNMSEESDFIVHQSLPVKIATYTCYAQSVMYFFL